MVLNLYGPPVSAGETKHMDYGRRRGPMYFEDHEANTPFSQTLSQYGYQHKWHRDRINRDLAVVEDLHAAIDEPPSPHAPYDPTGAIIPTGTQNYHTFVLGIGKWKDDIKDEIIERKKELRRKPHLNVPEGQMWQPTTTTAWRVEDSQPRDVQMYTEDKLASYFNMHDKHDNVIHPYDLDRHPVDEDIEEPVELLHPHLDHNAHVPANEKRNAMQHVRMSRDKYYKNSSAKPPQPHELSATHADKRDDDVANLFKIVDKVPLPPQTRPHLSMKFLDALPWPHPEKVMASVHASEVDKHTPGPHSH